MKSDEIETYSSRPLTEQRFASQLHIFIFRASIGPHSTVQSHYNMPNKNVYLYITESLSMLNGPVLEDGLKGILEGRQYKGLKIIFSSVAATYDRWLRILLTFKTTKMATIHFKINLYLCQNVDENCSHVLKSMFLVV